MQNSHTFDLSKLGINAWKLVKPESLVMSSYEFIVISEEVKEENIELLSSKLSIPNEKILTFTNVEEFKKTVKSGNNFCIIQVLTKEPSEKEIFDYSQFENVIVGFYLYTYDWNFIKDKQALKHIINCFSALKRGFTDGYPEELMRGSIDEVEETTQEQLPFSFVILSDEEVFSEEIHEFEEVLRLIGPTSQTQYLTNPNSITYPESGKLCIINFSSYSYDTRGKENKVFCYLHLKDILDLLDDIQGKAARITINRALNVYAEGKEDKCFDFIDPEIRKIVYSSDNAIINNSYEKKAPQIQGSIENRETKYSVETEANALNQQRVLDDGISSTQDTSNNQADNSASYHQNSKNQQNYSNQYSKNSNQNYQNNNNQAKQYSNSNNSNQRTNSTMNQNRDNRGTIGYRPFNTLQSQAAFKGGKDIGFVFLAMPVSNQNEQGVINQYLQGLGIKNSIFLQSFEDLRNFIQNQPNFIINVITFLEGNPQDYGVFNFGFAVGVNNWQQLLEGEVQNLIFNLNLASKAGYKNSYLNLQLR